MAGVVVEFEGHDGFLGELEDEQNPDLGNEVVVEPAWVDVFGHPGVGFVAGAGHGVGGWREGGRAGEAEVEGGSAGDELKGCGVTSCCWVANRAGLVFPEFFQ